MKVAFVSLGCDKNLSDSEHMLYLLQKAGMEISSEEEADVIVVNTCCFIESALEESINNIIRCGQYKTEGQLKGLVVTGCMSERYKDDIRREIPEVDSIVSINSYGKIVEAVLDAAGSNKNEYISPLSDLPDEGAGRINGTGMPYDYLKIAEGCDKHCTYCIIPSLRGPYRSIPMEVLIDEAEKMAASGTTELNIVAQETTLYGIDLYGKKSLTELLDRLSQIEGIEWLRLLYCYPESIDDELIDYMASNPKVLHYIDMPIQHADDYILGRMGRKTSQADIKAKIKALRDKMPDIALRTTLISGFPGETEEMHDTMKSFIKDVKFDRLGVFTYSREKGTPAYDMPGQVPKDIKEKRKDELMLLQQAVCFEKAKELVGKDIKTFVAGYLSDKGLYVGRTYMDAPEVDNFIFFESDIDLLSGQIVSVHVTDAKDYDLYGELVK